MKLIKKIKAFFCRNNEPVELDLEAAEIKEGRAYLHTKGEESVTYLVKANDVEIQLNKGASLREADILKFRKKSPEEKRAGSQQKQIEKKTELPKVKTEKSVSPPTAIADDRFKKRVFSVSVYPEEYEMLVESVKAYGYKRPTLYWLA